MESWAVGVVMCEFRVLGGLELVRDGVPLALASRRQRALIARLVLGRGQLVPAEALVAALWEDAPPAGVRHALHAHLSRLRRLLGATVVTRAPGYLLAAPPEAVDAERFESAVVAAAELIADHPAAAVAGYDRALALCRGPAYAEFAGSFARAAAARLDELRRSARAGRAEALLRTGRLDQAVGELGELVAEQPLRERPHGQLMRALYLAGRQTEALEVFEQFRRRVAAELGLDPSPALRQVHEQVLRQAVGGPAGQDRAAVPDRAAGSPVRWPARWTGPWCW